MATVTRSTKDNGSTNWVSPDTLNANDLNGDINPIVAAFAGNINADNLADDAVTLAKLADNSVVDANVTSAAAIATQKLSQTDADWSEGTGTRSGSGSWTTGLETDAVTSHSTSTVLYGTTTDPGNSASFTYPDTLSQELERLRYMLKRLGIGVNAKLDDATNAAAWFDGNVTGPNLIANSAFLDYVASGATAPQGWTAVGTSPTFNGQSTALDVTEGAGKALLFDPGNSDNNMTQTLSKLKASTKYLIEARMKPAAGTTKLITTGAGSGTFVDLDLVSSGTSWQTLSGVIVTDSTPTDIVVKIDPQGTDAVQIAYVACKEISFADRLGRNDVSGIAVRSTSDSATPGTVAAALTGSVVVPCPNCRIRVTVNVGVESSASGAGGINMTLSENINGGGASAVALSKTLWRNDDGFGPVHIDYVNSSPTVGGVHAYTISLVVINSAVTVSGEYHWMQVEVITP